MTTPLLRWCSVLLPLAVASALSSCQRDTSADGKSSREAAAAMAWWTGKVTIDGSSTVLPLSMAIGEAFQKANPSFRLAIESSGTAGGFRKLCAGKVTLANASRPINAAEAAACKASGVEYIELPIAFDGLTVVVSANNTSVDCLKVSELKAIWEPAAEGKITRWDQVRSSFPAQPLKLFGPGKDSGTFDYFTLAVVGAESKSRHDFTSSEDDTVIERAVAEDPNAIGFFGYAYYLANKEKVKAVAIDNGAGCVAPTADTVGNAYQPLSRPLFVYVNLAVATQPEVRAFSRFLLAPENAKHINKVGYLPLSASTMQAQLSRFENRVRGSALGTSGSVTGLKPESFEQGKTP
jgi:phosphate transport system substrate-binding protein